MMVDERKSVGRAWRRSRLTHQLSFVDRICEWIVERHEDDLFLLNVCKCIVRKARTFRVVIRRGPDVTPAGVNVENVAG